MPQLSQVPSSILAHVVLLFDSDGTHTFVAKTFVDRIGVMVNDLGYDLVVSTLAGATFTTQVCVCVCEGCCCPYLVT